MASCSPAQRLGRLAWGVHKALLPLGSASSGPPHLPLAQRIQRLSRPWPGASPRVSGRAHSSCSQKGRGRVETGGCRPVSALPLPHPLWPLSGTPAHSPLTQAPVPFVGQWLGTKALLEEPKKGAEAAKSLKAFQALPASLGPEGQERRPPCRVPKKPWLSQRGQRRLNVSRE